MASATSTRRQFLGFAALGATALLGLDRSVLAAAARAVAPAPPRFRSRPLLDPPLVTVTATGADPATGLFFVAPFTVAGPAASATAAAPSIQVGPLIVDAGGHVVWFRQLAEGLAATDFRTQSYRGKPVLTWWEGKVLGGYGEGEGVILDDTYTEVARVQAGNGFQADLHEFQLTPQNTALVTAYTTQGADLSAVGGPGGGMLLDSLVQEVDVATGKVLFEWRASDHVGLDESQAAVPTTGAAPFDFFHVNAVAPDTDGNLLVSARNTWTVYKLDRQSGEILWRLGGSKSDFAFGDQAAFAWQHHARRQADGSITLFDNAAASFPTETEPQSRGLVLDVDENAMTASFVREYVHPQGLVVVAMGSMQPLPGGDVVVGWGVELRFNQFASGGEVGLEGVFPSGAISYRAFRLPWTGKPATAPAHATVLDGDGTTTVYASWDGATDVARWQVLAGPRASELRPLRSAERKSFETAIPVRVAGGLLAVAALDASGRVLATSKPEAV
jgi:outer membrane protein assembly factor BamB